MAQPGGNSFFRSPNAGTPRGRRTAKTRQPVQRWFPQRADFRTYQEWDTHYRAWQHIYALQDQVAAIARAQATSTAAAINSAGAGGGNSSTGDSGVSSGDASQIKSKNGQTAPGVISATHLMGIAIEPSTPLDGQTLTFKASRGVFVWA